MPMKIGLLWEFAIEIKGYDEKILVEEKMKYRSSDNIEYRYHSSHHYVSFWVRVSVLVSDSD